MVAAVRPRAHIVGDLPFGSYQASDEDAVRAAVRLMKAGAESVKLEGGVNVADRIAAIARADIPVMGHIGLTPQSYHRMGGNRIQGRTSGEGPGTRERIMEDAHAVEQAGAFGAGPSCDGQVLVLHDLLGLSPRKLSFARAYADLHSTAVAAVKEYAAEVRSRAWPDPAHSFD
jgi:3-methyl-2-oxobutanoate hydroxymethyltransferase